MVRLRGHWPACTLSFIVLTSCSYDWDRFDPGARDAGRDASSTLVPLVVEPIYPAHARWNDYVQNADPARGPHAQPDEPCEVSEPIGYSACIHGGEKRRVALPADVQCEDVTIADALDAFEWECVAAEENDTFVSRGLQPDRGLADLVDGSEWKPNHVTVLREGQPFAESPPEVWWTNPVQPLPDNRSGTESVPLDEAGVIYVLDTTRETNGYHIAADHVGVVVLDGAELRWAGTASSNCDDVEPPLGESARCLLSAHDVRFLWLEGDFDGGSGGTSANRPVYLSSVAFAHVRRARIRGGAYAGLLLRTTRDSYLYGVESTDVDGIGVYLRDVSSFNTLERIVAHGNAGHGVACYSPAGALAAGNVLRDVVAHGNDENGINIGARCRFTTIRDIATHTNSQHGLRIESEDVNVARVLSANNRMEGVRVYASRVVVVDAVVFNNHAYGLSVDRTGVRDGVWTRITSFANGGPLRLGRTGSATVSHVTAMNHGGNGLRLDAASDATIAQVLTVNNGLNGVHIDSGASGATFTHVATSDNVQHGIDIAAGSVGHRFTGVLVVGPQGEARCQVGTGGEGLVDGTCSDSGSEGSMTYGDSASDAVLLVEGVDVADAFVGRVTSDRRNAAGALGLSPYVAIEDWERFENPFRGWGLESNTPFPGAAHAGRCTSGDCRIWDLRLRSTDTVFRGVSGNGRTPNEPFVPGEPCPPEVDGDRVITDGLGVPNTFLVHATEILDDGIGDDDGLCESGEACLYSPNFGAYQGEGDYIAGGTCMFRDGVVSEVQMYAYPVNGG